MRLPPSHESNAGRCHNSWSKNKNMKNTKLTRDSKGRWTTQAVVDSKFIIVCLLVAFTMIGTAYYAQAQVKNYEPNGNPPSLDEDSGRATTTNSRTCLVSGDTTFCATNGDVLVRAIQADERGYDGVSTVQTKPAIQTKTIPKSNYQRKSSNPAIEAIIRQEAEAQGYADVELALDIVDCESRFDPNATNGRGNTPSYSIDEGLWQYNDFHQRFNITSECAFSVSCSTRQAIKDLKNGKASQWSCYRLVR